MTVLDAIIQGIIQGATEFLPVSSSGHLSVSQHIFGLQVPDILFDVMLHFGTLIAVLFVYRKLVWRLIREFFSTIGDIFRGRFSFKNLSGDRRLLMMLIVGLLPLFLLFLPIPGTGMNIKDLSETLASDSGILVEGLSLLTTSLLLFIAVSANSRATTYQGQSNRSNVREASRRKIIRTSDALLIGLAQCFAAVFPGLSRSGSTLAVGLVRKIDRETALDYSFVLGIPAIAAATVLSLKDIGSTGEQIGILPLLAGVLTAMIVGFLAIRILKWLVKTDRLKIFAYYTLILGLAVTAIGIVEHVKGVNLFTGNPL